MIYKFGQLFDIIDGDRGKNYPSDSDFLDEGYCLFLNAGNVTKAGWSFENNAFITREKDEQLRKGRVNRGNTVFTTRGTVGNAAFYDDRVPYVHLRINSGMVILSAKDNEKIDNRFIYYLVTSPIARKTIELFCSGSAQPQLPIKDFIKIKYDLPSLESQRKIVDILSSYDNLIEVNNKRIKVLEQMAENLYKEWFVRFRFPGHETAEFYESRIGKLPRAFQVVKNKDVYEYYIGGGWGNDDEDKEYSVPAYVIRGTDFPRVKRGDISSCPLRYHKASNFSARKLKANDIIIEVSGGTAEQPVGRALIVTQDVIDRLMGRVICASFCKQVRVNSAAVSPLYYYYWMKFLYDTRIIDRFQLQSTGIINFQFEFFINNGEVMLPPIELMQQFDSLVLPIMDQISIIAKQNENLIKQRDLLLPRLMSGKLEVL